MTEDKALEAMREASLALAGTLYAAEDVVAALRGEADQIEAQCNGGDQVGINDVMSAVEWRLRGKEMAVRELTTEEEATG